MTLKHQGGAALFITLLMVMLIGSVGALLLSQSDMELKMTSAAASRAQAEKRLEGVANEYLTRTGIEKILVTLKENVELTDNSEVYTDVDILAMGLGSNGCQRGYVTSSTEITSCRYISMEMSDAYGKGRVQTDANTVSRQGEVTLGLGVEQPFLSPFNK